LPGHHRKTNDCHCDVSSLLRTPPHRAYAHVIWRPRKITTTPLNRCNSNCFVSSVLCNAVAETPDFVKIAVNAHPNPSQTHFNAFGPRNPAGCGWQYRRHCRSPAAGRRATQIGLRPPKVVRLPQREEFKYTLFSGARASV
jgi:hypothetical protein